MSDTPFIRSSDGQQRNGMTETGDAKGIVVANTLIGHLIGKQLVQFRMGYGVHLELGDDHEVTIETPFAVSDGDNRWAGEPLTAGAAGALLPLNLREVTFGRIATDCALVLGLGSATVTVPPAPMSGLHAGYLDETGSPEGARQCADRGRSGCSSDTSRLVMRARLHALGGGSIEKR